MWFQIHSNKSNGIESVRLPDGYFTFEGKTHLHYCQCFFHTCGSRKYLQSVMTENR